MSIGERMKMFLQSRFGTVTEAARAYDNKSSNYFQPYFTSKSVPGGELLAQFAEWGCNVNWLLTGDGAMTLEEEEARLEHEREMQSRLSSMQSVQLNAATARAGIPPTIDNPPDEVIVAREFRAVNDYSVMVTTQEGKRILYVKTNE